jgi:lysozyme
MSDDTVLCGFDIYHADGAIDFDAAKGAGASFVYAKATEGLDCVDPMYTHNRGAACTAGIAFGSYHFFDAFADPIDQARHFMNVARPRVGELLPALDVEVGSAAVGDEALACARSIKELCGLLPLLYSGQAFYLQYLKNVFPSETVLWIARYGAAPEVAHAMWQWSPAAREPGAPHPLDGDRMSGGLEMLSRLTVR